MPTLPAQLTLEMRNVTFVFVTMALKEMVLFAKVWEHLKPIVAYNIGVCLVFVVIIIFTRIIH